jgi:hypothetical protein
MYAAINAAGKKTKLRMKKPKKLCPLPAATRAGQKAIATHTMMNRIDQSHISDLQVYAVSFHDYRFENARFRHTDRTKFTTIAVSCESVAAARDSRHAGVTRHQ